MKANYSEIGLLLLAIVIGLWLIQYYAAYKAKLHVPGTLQPNFFYTGPGPSVPGHTLMN